MKNLKKWSMKILMLATLPLMVACGDDDSDNTTNLTTEEIVNMLTGNWAIKGTVRVDYEDYYLALEGDNSGTKDYDLKWEGDYTGTIEFKENKGCDIQTSKILLRDSQGNIWRDKGNNSFSCSLSYLIYEDKYSVLRKNGKSYITFGKQSFQIVALNKNSFKLVEDEDLDGYGGTKHYYITIISE